MVLMLKISGGLTGEILRGWFLIYTNGEARQIPEGILPNDYPGTFKFEFKMNTEVEASFDGYRAFTASFPKFHKK